MGRDLTAGDQTSGRLPWFALTVHLPVSARAAAMARTTVDAALARCGLDALADDAVLVTSELVTDALRRCGDDVFLEVAVADGALEIAVTSAGAVVPTPRPPLDVAEDDHRGQVVSRLTSASGVDEQPRGRRRAWVRFPLSGPDHPTAG